MSLRRWKTNLGRQITPTGGRMKTLTKWLGRLLWVIALLLLAVVIFGPAYVERGRNAVTDHAPYSPSAAAQTLHADLIIGDWHADPLLWNRDLNERGTRGHVDIPRLIEGNVALQVFTAVTKSPAGQNITENRADTFDNITPLAIGQLWPPRTWNSLAERALYQAEKLHKVANQSGDRLRILTTRSDLDQLLDARAAGRDIVGGILGIEGAHALEGDIANLDRLANAGHRLIGLHHFFDNELGGSLHGIGNQGLTDFGRAVVQQIVDRNMILDVAHSSPQVVTDVLDMTDIPIVISHTGIYSHCQSPRNISDDLMKRIAATGGVIAIGYWKTVTCDTSPDGVAATIRAAVDLVGEDHVSLGSDFDGSVRVDFDASELAVLTDALLRAGLTEPQIRKIAGENMLRVLRARLSD